MTVGELRKLLEGIPDDIKVVHHDLELDVFYHVEKAALLLVCDSHDGDYGDYVDPNSDGRYEKDPTREVFVVDLP